MKKFNHGWLPQDEKAEFDTANKLIDYVSKENVYTFVGFAVSRDINPKDFIDLKNCEGFLPNSCCLAAAILDTKTDNPFSEMVWKDKNGLCWLELCLMNDIGEWYVKNFEQLNR